VSTSDAKPSNDAAETLARYHAALARTHALIDLQHQRSPSRAAMRERATARMIRLRQLLAALGDPHQTVPIVHIAGTSGKGSTATAIASIIAETGYRTGLHTSPYLQAATEKLQIDRELIDARDFAGLVDDMLHRAERLPAFAASPITYGELWVAMTLAWLSRERVDALVLETGAGGRFDLTNVVTPVISVITSIGLDHTETLGPTIADIAWHKAGIIKPGVPVVTAVRDAEALEVITREAELRQSRIVFPTPESDRVEGFRAFTDFQQANLALAAATSRELRQLGFAIAEEQIARGLAGARIPGRIETVQHEPLVLIDGAHNPQKVASLAEALPALAPPGQGGTRTLLFGSLDVKNHAEMLALLLPHAGRLILTAPRVYGKTSSDPAALAQEVAATGYRGDVWVIPEPERAIDTALASSSPEDAVVVAGSMYLAGNVRERWFRTDDVVLQRTPWPADAA
jgi:dihydrofolate synthase/folylpolyglutamate synthase